MKHITPHRKQNVGAAAIAVAVLGMAAFAGCIGTADEELSPNLAPAALLTVDRDERWTGERFTFNANGSSDPDGEITRYHFDFGDGNEATFESSDNVSSVKHAYTAGGAYPVTLTVTDDGDNATGKLTHTTHLVVLVHERGHVPLQVGYAPPTGNETVPRSTFAFEAAEYADTLEMDLELRSTLLVGSTEVLVRIVDADGEEVYAENVTLTPGQNVTLEVSESIDAGNFTLEMVVKSGGAALEGAYRIYYASPEASEE